VVDGEFIGPGGADEFEHAVAPGDLDDEAEVEARPALERLDALEEGRVLGRRLRSAVQHGGLDLDLLGNGPSARGVEAYPLLPRAVLHGERLEATRRLQEEEGGMRSRCEDLAADVRAICASGRGGVKVFRTG
jgi:hypothetical protein